MHTIEVAVGAGVPAVGRSRRRSCASSRTCSRSCRATRRRRCSSRSTSSARSARSTACCSTRDATASLGGNAVRGGRVGAGCRDGRAAEVPGRPVGVSAPITPVGARGRGDPVAQQGSRPASARSPTRTPADFVRSNYFDLGMILDYWGPRRLNHHTEATIDAVRAPASARAIICSRRAGRPSSTGTGGAGAAMLAGVRGLGPVGVRRRRAQDEQRRRGRDPRRRAGRRRARARCCRTSASRSARRSGRCTARVWRIGTMGYNARQDAVLQTLAALERCCAGSVRRVPAGGGVDAAMDVYADAGRERIASTLTPDASRRRRGASWRAATSSRAYTSMAGRDRARLPLARARAREPPRRRVDARGRA